MSCEKNLIINADDFGQTLGINDGIVIAHLRGILTSTTIMATGTAFDHAVKLSHKYPSLDIGCHLTLVGGPSQPYTVKELVKKMLRGKVNVEGELDAQIRRCLDAGIKLTHLDTHKHTHLLPTVLKVVARLSRKYSIPWVRRPFDFPMQSGTVPGSRKAISRALGLVRWWFQRTLRTYGCRTTDHFAGFSLTGFLQTSELVELLQKLPEGTTELMTHPGYCDEELRYGTSRLKESREAELRALVSDEAKQAIKENGIRLVGYHQL
ncbi:MAG: ChbG/HpnK family deacetylase [Candidatus Solibacter usitatus]|nr:ChbG/HpnK family deacetylase [Candidatus Solibacter usitatus]